MIEMRLKRLLIGLTSLLYLQVMVQAQANGCYHYLTFSEFERFYTPADKLYLKAIYKTIKYPPVLRENQQEGVVRVQLINHSKEQIEVIVSGSTHQQFLDVTRKSIEEANSEYLTQTDHKFITNFYVEYDLEPFDKEERCKPSDDDCFYVIILAYQVPLIDR